MEFALLAPVFFMLVFGVAECALALWTQVGLQHGVEMAARCASINSTLCGSNSAIKTYAVQQAYGLSLPTTTFTPTTAACGSKVSASYTYKFITTFFGKPQVTLTAQACFPK